MGRAEAKVASRFLIWATGWPVVPSSELGAGRRTRAEEGVAGGRGMRSWVTLGRGLCNRAAQRWVPKPRALRQTLCSNPSLPPSCFS